MIGIRRRERPEIATVVPMPVIRGFAKVDVRTKDLVKRLDRGDVAIIDHLDLDRVSAESLVDRGISAVINARPSSSGRYPNDGPLVVLDAGIVLLDGCGPHVMDIANGATVGIDGDEIRVNGAVIGAGVRQNHDRILALHEASRSGLGREFVDFMRNTMEYAEDNLDLLSDDLAIPDIGLSFNGRHVLLVVRGHDYREDLELIRGSGYISEMKPILVGVDGGADALLDSGLVPDVIVGDFDSVSERAINSGAHLVVHAYRDGRAPGAQRLDEMGVSFHTFCASGTSEDIAMLLAYEDDAELIVAVGTHSSMVDFLDKGRRGMASTVVTRMKVGDVLVDAKGVSRLYKTRVRKRDLLMMVAAAVVVLLVIAAVSEPIQLIIRAYWADFRN